MILWFIAKKPYFTWLPKLNNLLQTWRDDIFLATILGVVLGGRLGEVVLYDPAYYIAHPSKILAVWDWGMSFLWGIVWVIMAMVFLSRRYKLSIREFRALWDIVVLIVPVGSLLWRIGNFLNQELVWRPIDSLPIIMQTMLRDLQLTYIFPAIDYIERVNAPIMQSITEGWVLLVIVWLAMYYVYARHYKFRSRVAYWMVAWVFLCGYAIIRFGIEYFKDYSPAELYRDWMTRTQLLVIIVFISWCWVIITAKK
jgi:phosphatidylglycerol---prolipoprotein diacylglyceryl transferase